MNDRTLQKFVLINILFTAYLSQIQSTLPLFLSRYLPVAETSLSAGFISSLFTVYVLLTAITQMPVARFFRRRSHRFMLQVSNVTWVTGFLVLACMGFAASAMVTATASTAAILSVIQVWTIVSLVVLSLATVTYLPAASAFVAELAPEQLRGTYLSINSQCWAVGYFLGPTLGGWALDQLQEQAFLLWGAVALCGVLVGAGLQSLASTRAMS